MAENEVCWGLAYSSFFFHIPSELVMSLGASRLQHAHWMAGFFLVTRVVQGLPIPTTQSSVLTGLCSGGFWYCVLESHPDCRCWRRSIIALGFDQDQDQNQELNDNGDSHDGIDK